MGAQAKSCLISCLAMENFFLRRIEDCGMPSAFANGTAVLMDTVRLVERGGNNR
jgi:hypothetical protein